MECVPFPQRGFGRRRVNLNTDSTAIRLAAAVTADTELADIDPFDDEHVVRLHRRNLCEWVRLLERGQRCALWCGSGRSTMRPVGLLASATWGAWPRRGLGILELRRDRLRIERCGRVRADWTSEKHGRLGSLRYGRLMSVVGWGTAELHDEDTRFCTLKLPLLGPSLYQRKDCLGYFTLPAHRRLYFVLNPAIPRNEILPAYRDARDDAFAVGPAESQSPLFLRGQEEILLSCTRPQRMLLIGTALWALQCYGFAS